MPVLGISLLVSGGVGVVRAGGGLEAAELVVYDRMLQLRPQEPPDPNLLIVLVTEADLQAQKQWPLSGDTLYEVLTTLDRYEPAGIGLDIYRDLPVEPGHEKLTTLLAENKFITPICLLKGDTIAGVAPPPDISPQRLGFANIPIDAGGVVRRALIFSDPAPDSPCQTPYALGFHMARLYLQQQGIQPDRNSQEELTFNGVRFPKLSTTPGGYQKIDTGGYQLLLNYRCSRVSRVNSGTNSATNSEVNSGTSSIDLSIPTCSPTDQVVTLTEVLQGKLTPQQVQGKMVLIGASAPSIDDAFYTPYSQGDVSKRLPGVMVHAQIASQLVSTALGGRRLLWYLSDGAELLLILAWAGVGAVSQGGGDGSIHRRSGKVSPWQMWRVGGGWLLWGGMVGSGLFLGGWLPVVATGLSLTLSMLGVLGYRVYQQQQQAKVIAQLLREQSEDLALLRSLLKEQPTANLESSPQSITSDLPSHDWTTTAMPPEGLINPRNYVDHSQIDEKDEDTAIAPPYTPPPKKTLNQGRYVIEKVLGSGGFGKIYIATDTQQSSPSTQSPKITCVIKHLQPARKDARFLQVARRLFRTEGEILAQLGLHSQIPELIAYFEEENDFYLVEEHIPGFPLSHDLQSGQRWDAAKVLDLLQQLLTVLDFIHRRGVIHRDLKPSNIIRTPAGKLVLIDFGAVKQITPQDPNFDRSSIFETSGEIPEQANWTIAIGTRGYSPPEQYAGQPGFGSDIYALGIIAIQALTGIHPLNFPIDVGTGEVDWHQFVNIPEELKQIIDQMVRFHFRDRYQSARKILTDLKSLPPLS
ncbi:MAG: CHASE2 domain-containing protein [Coleofasciculaceae cyanobacterium SM2_1_6]|nr:CHASE2 domain-containing protein [Coleofasciculaceae cyanobacterium SM2_1_6]